MYKEIDDKLKTGRVWRTWRPTAKLTTITEKQKSLITAMDITIGRKIENKIKRDKIRNEIKAKSAIRANYW